jgi:alkylation response protein AidB-like acyl-CoA dehydrogenase
MRPNKHLERAAGRTDVKKIGDEMVMAGPSDRSDVVGTLPQTERRDFSAVGYAEAMRRAREIVPILRERAAPAEDARMLLRENEQLLHESGLFRFHQPKSFGGMELDFVAVVDIPAELARGCPSTAWNVGNVACHHWILGYYVPQIALILLLFLPDGEPYPCLAPQARAGAFCGLER